MSNADNSRPREFWIELEGDPDKPLSDQVWQVTDTAITPKVLE